MYSTLTDDAITIVIYSSFNHLENESLLHNCTRTKYFFNG